MHGPLASRFEVGVIADAREYGGAALLVYESRSAAPAPAYNSRHGRWILIRTSQPGAGARRDIRVTARAIASMKQNSFGSWNRIRRHSAGSLEEACATAGLSARKYHSRGRRTCKCPRLASVLSRCSPRRGLTGLQGNA